MAAKPTIQRGTLTVTNSQAISFSAVRGVASGFDTTVDPTKTILLWALEENGTGPLAMFRARLVDGDTITFDRGVSGVGTNITGVFSWTLISFASGVTVQHLTANMSTVETSKAVSIAGAGSGGRFIIGGGATASGSPTVGAWATRWRITSDTEATVDRQATGSMATDTACQVIEWDNATVEVVSMSAETWAATTLDKTIASTDASKALVFGTGWLTSNGPADMQVRFTLPASTTLRLTRAGSTSRVYTATIYVVRIASGIAVQYHDTALSAVTSNTSTLSPAVVVADTVPSTPTLENNWSKGSSTEIAFNRTLGRPAITNTTTLTLTRNTGTGDVTYTTQAIEFVVVGPTITTQPTAVTRVLTNSNVATFTAAATGTAPVTAQWQLETSVGSGTYANVANGDGLTFSGGTTDTLTVTIANKTASGRRLRCRYTDANGFTDTNAVALTIFDGPQVTTFPATDGSGVSTATLTCDYVCGVGEFIEVAIVLPDGRVANTTVTT